MPLLKDFLYGRAFAAVNFYLIPPTSKTGAPSPFLGKTLSKWQNVGVFPSVFLRGGVKKSLF